MIRVPVLLGTLGLLGLLGLVAFAVACGRRTVAPARPLWPELYEIAKDDVPAPGDFIRYAAPGPKGGGLDVAVTEYARDEPGSARVQLVGVVHVADPPYYERIQEVLDAADLVLFEAIKPAEMDMETWMASGAGDPEGLEGFQEEIASWFGFRYQLDAIDYGDPRYVHADMSIEQFLEEAGPDLRDQLPFHVGEGDDAALPDSVQSVLEYVRPFGRLLAEPNPLQSLARRLLAEALGRLDTVESLGMFPAVGRLILDRRNEVVVEHLQRHLEGQRGRIAIFYGAAHNPDLERRLLKLGYRRTSAFWVRAWALRPPLAE